MQFCSICYEENLYIRAIGLNSSLQKSTNEFIKSFINNSPIPNGNVFNIFKRKMEYIILSIQMSLMVYIGLLMYKSLMNIKLNFFLSLLKYIAILVIIALIFPYIQRYLHVYGLLVLNVYAIFAAILFYIFILILIIKAIYIRNKTRSR